MLCAYANGTKTGAIASDTDSIPLIIDTGASAVMSPSQEDFVNLKETRNVWVGSIGSGQTVLSKGTLKGPLLMTLDKHVILLYAMHITFPKALHIFLVYNN